MKRLYILILTCIVILTAAYPLLAGGSLRKLKNIGDSMALQQRVFNEEAENYRKADSFISSAAAEKGLSKEYISAVCGDPVVIVQDGTKWVYKPPSSTFFKGEKIYLFFGEDGKLINWEQAYQ